MMAYVTPIPTRTPHATDEQITAVSTPFRVMRLLGRSARCGREPSVSMSAPVRDAVCGCVVVECRGKRGIPLFGCNDKGTVILGKEVSTLLTSFLSTLV